MKLQDWSKREDLQLEWKKLWETNEALKAGFDVLREVALPIESRPPPGTDLIDYSALLNSRREGYYDCLRNIDALKNIKPQVENLPEPWERVNKQETQEK